MSVLEKIKWLQDVLVTRNQDLGLYIEPSIERTFNEIIFELEAESEKQNNQNLMPLCSEVSVNPKMVING